MTRAISLQLNNPIHAFIAGALVAFALTAMVAVAVSSTAADAPSAQSYHFGPIEYAAAYSEAFDQQLAATIGAMVYLPESLYETMVKTTDLMAAVEMAPVQVLADAMGDFLYENGLY